MNYLNQLTLELKSAGIPPRRRRRIVAEFADHLHENPEAELGAPEQIARQFADELGTRFARVTAYSAFVRLAIAGAVLVAALLDGSRSAWNGYGAGAHDASPLWYVIVLGICALAAQVAFAAGCLALVRAYRLRRAPVISNADAGILNRRAGVAVSAGAIAMLVLPLSLIPQHHRLDGTAWWAHPLVGVIPIVVLLLALPGVLAAVRLRPSREGVPRDLSFDLGTSDGRVTPWRVAAVLSLVILLVLAVTGLASDDPYDGIARGLLDAAACMIGFTVLGTYLGLRTPARTTS